MDIVRYYTREAGVRNLEREVAKIGRKAVKQLLLEKKEQKQVAITPRNLDKYLGVRRFRYGKAEDQNRVGQVTGLGMDRGGRRAADDRSRGRARARASCNTPASWAR